MESSEKRIEDLLFEISLDIEKSQMIVDPSEAKTQLYFENNTSAKDRVIIRSLRHNESYSEGFLAGLEMAKVALNSRLTEIGKKRIEELVTQFAKIRDKNNQKTFSFLNEKLPTKKQKR